MAERNRMPPSAMKGPPPPSLHDHPPPPFPRGPIHPALLDDLRGPLAPPPHHPAALIEERLAAQYEEIQALLVDNQRLAATHVALKQELSAAQNELRRASHGFAAVQADKDLHLREIYEKSMKMEQELRAGEAMQAELVQVRGDIQRLNATRQELMLQVQALNQDCARALAELQQAPAIKAEIETLKQEIQHVRSGIELEKKGYAENYEQGQVMENYLISMAREVEKLRAEVYTAEKSSRAAVATGNQGYAGNYANPESSFVADPYPGGYSMNPVPGGGDAGSQYGAGSAPGSWAGGSYDMQWAQGRR